jgi:hypothetical protein
MIYDRLESTDSNGNNIGTINDETILKITNAVLASDSNNEIFYFLLQVYQTVYGIKTKDLQAQFIAEWCEIYRHFGIETVQQVIEKVRKLVTDDNLMEREDIDNEIDGMMAVGVVWLTKLHQRHGDGVTSECNSGINTAMTSTSNILNVIPKTRDMWIADSGASCHMKNSRIGMTNLIKNDSKIKIGKW